MDSELRVQVLIQLQHPGLEDEDLEGARAAAAAPRAARREEDYFDGDEEPDEMDDFLDDDLGGAPGERRTRRARSGAPAGTSAAAMRVCAPERAPPSSCQTQV